MLQSVPLVDAIVEQRCLRKYQSIAGNVRSLVIALLHVCVRVQYLCVYVRVTDVVCVSVYIQRLQNHTLLNNLLLN